MAISKQTAIDIAMAYREIEAAEELLKKVDTALARHEEPDLRDAFGRRKGGLQLGVPSGHGSTSLYDVPWTLARPIIETHIATQRAVVAALTEKARAEIEVHDFHHQPSED